MGRSFGLAAYRALSRRATPRRYTTDMERPKGPLVWIHAPAPDSLLAVEDLAQRLCATRPDIHVLITVPDQETLKRAGKNDLPRDKVMMDKVPSEHPEAVSGFWRHWHPDIGIWARGHLRPNLLIQTHAAKCAMMLIDADTDGFDGRRDRWLPDLSRQLLEPFLAVMVRSSEALQRVETLGLPTGRISLMPALEAGGLTLSCEDSDLADLSERLRGRPVWFASNIQEAELSAVLSAHREALRLSHRLLLILHPAREDLAQLFAQGVTDEGYRLSNWTKGDEIDDSTQVLLAPDVADLGLFYRASPISFMGSSLIAKKPGRNPFEAAALGSAVLYGPNVSMFMPFYSRLAKAGAARIVKDEKTLGAAVTQLIAPDRAAAMAHAGWDVVSQGADLTDRVVEMVEDVLDGTLEVGDARA